MLMKNLFVLFSLLFMTVGFTSCRDSKAKKPKIEEEGVGVDPGSPVKKVEGVEPVEGVKPVKGVKPIGEEEPEGEVEPKGEVEPEGEVEPKGEVEGQ